MSRILSTYAGTCADTLTYRQEDKKFENRVAFITQHFFPINKYEADRQTNPLVFYYIHVKTNIPTITFFKGREKKNLKKDKCVVA